MNILDRLIALRDGMRKRAATLKDEAAKAKPDDPTREVKLAMSDAVGGDAMELNLILSEVTGSASKPSALEGEGKLAFMPDLGGVAELREQLAETGARLTQLVSQAFERATVFESRAEDVRLSNLQRLDAAAFARDLNTFAMMLQQELEAVGLDDGTRPDPRHAEKLRDRPRAAVIISAADTRVGLALARRFFELRAEIQVAQSLYTARPLQPWEELALDERHLTATVFVALMSEARDERQSWVREYMESEAARMRVAVGMVEPSAVGRFVTLRDAFFADAVEEARSGLKGDERRAPPLPPTAKVAAIHYNENPSPDLLDPACFTYYEGSTFTHDKRKVTCEACKATPSMKGTR